MFSFFLRSIYAEQEVSDVADVDIEEEEAEEFDVDLTFSSDSASSSFPSPEGVDRVETCVSL